MFTVDSPSAFDMLFSPVGFLAACFIIILTGLGLSLLRDRRMRRWYERICQGLCAECGYDLRASEGRCPECGAIKPTACAECGFEAVFPHHEHCPRCGFPQSPVPGDQRLPGTA